MVLLLFLAQKLKISYFGHVTFLGGHVRVPGLRTYQIRIPHKILGRNCGLTFVLAQKLENQFFGHVTFLGGHVMVPELRKYQIRIPRKILGRNCGLTFVSSSEIKNLIFWSRDLFRGSREGP